MPPAFTVTNAWREAHPGAAAGILLAREVANPPRHAALEEHKSALEQELRRRFAGQDRSALEELPVIQAYRAYYRRYQKTYHVLLQLESVALRGKPIPRVAALVEAMFMAELKNGLLTAGHDADTLRLPVRLDVAHGGERYLLLRGQEAVLKPGDMYMADEQGIISSILSGPDQRTQITPTTRAALFCVYAPPGIPREAVEAHLRDLWGFVTLVAPAARLEQMEVY